MRKYIIYILLLIIYVVPSCGNSNNVVSKFGIQKRKYNNGFYISKSDNYAIGNKSETKIESSSSDNEILAVKFSESKNMKLNITNNIDLLEVDGHLCDTISGIQRNFNEETTNTKSFFNSKILESTVNNGLKQVVDGEPKQEPKEYSFLLLVLLCFLIPFLAVGLKTNWDLVKVIIAFILWPSVIFAILFALLIVYEILGF